MLKYGVHGSAEAKGGEQTACLRRGREVEAGTSMDCGVAARSLASSAAEERDARPEAKSFCGLQCGSDAVVDGP